MPWTSKVVDGAVVRMPTRLLVASTDKVLVSKERPLTPPDKVKLVSLANVQASALEVRVSPAASPRVVLPVIEALPLIVKAVPTMAAALKPLETRSEPWKELEPVELPVKVPVKVVLPTTPRDEPRVVAPEMLAVPPTSRVVFNVLPLLMPNDVPK